MENMNAKQKVLITTSGIGSRLGELTDFTNKSLIAIGEKPALARIIEQYPTESKFVITLGHYGSHVKQFAELAFPERSFEFVDVKNFSGPKSSLAWSMLQAQEFLQEPFIFNASDSIVLNFRNIAKDGNWLGGFCGTDSSNYATFDSLAGHVNQIHEKGAVNFDYIHTGVIGIQDFVEFWECLETSIIEGKYTESLNDLSAIRRMIARGTVFSVNELDMWIDIGNSFALQQAESFFGNPHDVLRKNTESVSFLESRVLKFFSDPEKCSKRILKANKLQGLVPQILEVRENFYSYSYVTGTPLSKSRNPETFSHFLEWSSSKLWSSNDLVEDKLFESACEIFYRDKTLARLENFFTSRSVSDTENVINGEKVPPLSEFLEEGFKVCMMDCIQTRIHGDLILDNIIYNHPAFSLIDWREEFAGLSETGDLYYDLAKLNHSLIVNHEIISKGHFDIVVSPEIVSCSILVNDYSLAMRDIFRTWTSNKGISQKKISTLTSIVWLNMSPLHHHPFDLFLYFYGKLNLWRALNSATG